MGDKGIDREIEANERRNEQRPDAGEDVPGASLGVVTGSLLRPAGTDSVEASDTEAHREQNDADQQPGVIERIKRLVEG